MMEYKGINNTGKRNLHIKYHLERTTRRTCPLSNQVEYWFRARREVENGKGMEHPLKSPHRSRARASLPGGGSREEI